MWAYKTLDINSQQYSNITSIYLSVLDMFGLISAGEKLASHFWQHEENRSGSFFNRPRFLNVTNYTYSSTVLK